MVCTEGVIKEENKTCVQGWVIIRDTVQMVEAARALTTQLKWEARVIEVESSSDQRLLICQKPFTKRQSI